jgi:hypothetical protein
MFEGKKRPFEKLVTKWKYNGEKDLREIRFDQNISEENNESSDFMEVYADRL